MKNLKAPPPMYSARDVIQILESATKLGVTSLRIEGVEALWGEPAPGQPDHSPGPRGVDAPRTGVYSVPQENGGYQNRATVCTTCGRRKEQGNDGHLWCPPCWEQRKRDRGEWIEKQINHGKNSRRERYGR